MNKVGIEEEFRVDTTGTLETMIAEEISSAEVKQILEISTIEEAILMSKNR